VTSKPIDQWASTDVLAAVIDVEIAAFLRRAPSNNEALLALAARRELEDRMRRHRWLAMETARQAGASWAEIAAAAGMGPTDASRLYEQTWPTRRPTATPSPTATTPASRSCRRVPGRQTAGPGGRRPPGWSPQRRPIRIRPLPLLLLLPSSPPSPGSLSP
jgi:hypothetical protein